jgi:hypothetical protein
MEALLEPVHIDTGKSISRIYRVSQPLGRAVFVREDSWRTGARLSGTDKSDLLRGLTQRDVSLLQMVASQHYLTTDQVAALFFPSRRTAQMRLRWLRERKLLMRYTQFVPLLNGRRRLPSIFLLTERGAAVVAGCLGIPSGPTIKRSWTAAEYVLAMNHALGAIGFWITLALSASERQGLYIWISDDTLRSHFGSKKVDLSPDGHGVFLVEPGAEIDLYLEWDHSTEGKDRLEKKAKAYDMHTRGDYVLWVVPSDARERAVRGIIGPIAAEVALTTTIERLHREGPLGAIWQPVPGDGPRLALTDLPTHETDARIADCIGKPQWWERRLGGSQRA